MRQLGSHLVGLLVIRTGNPDIDRGWLTEIEHLVDNIGGLKEKLHPGETLGQLAAEPGHQGRCRCMFLLERNKDLPVHWTYGG